MDDDLIVVDDDNEAGPSSSSTVKMEGRGLRLRSGSSLVTPIDVSERTTRSSQKQKAAPKLKLKLSEKAASQAPGMSFLGQFDRELDSDEEDLAFEEQFILRMPPGEDCDRLRKAVASREVGNDVWFKFKDSRRAIFHVGNSLYSSKLVDLPCIVESQKTLDGKQMFKVADICQMLVVGDKIQSEEQMTRDKGFNIDEFIWPHGVTPPLHHVRKRRFRKRVNRRAIESVEQEVERLLDEDSLATDVKFDILDNVNPDLSDSEFIEQEAAIDAPTPAISDTAEPQTPGDLGEGDEDEDDNEEAPEGDIDEELAAELDLALENDEDEDGDDEDDDDSDEDESEDEDDDDSQARKLLNEEVRDLEAAVAKKRNEVATSNNPLIRKRFEDALKKLNADLELKVAQRDELKEKQRLKKEGISIDPADVNQNGQIASDEEDDLFGDDGMDLG